MVCLRRSKENFRCDIGYDVANSCIYMTDHISFCLFHFIFELRSIFMVMKILSKSNQSVLLKIAL